MKKTAIFIFLISFILSACGAFQSADPTPEILIQTPISDPCSPEMVLDEVEKIQKLVNQFQDVTFIAGYTQRPQLISPLMKLHEVRTGLEEIVVADCQASLKTATIDYMNRVIQYLSVYMGGDPEGEVIGLIQNSQFLWLTVMEEFNTVMENAGYSAQDLPEFGSQLPQVEDPVVLVRNEGSQSINVRSDPNLDAEILTTLEPSTQALGIGKNEAGDWIQINLDGLIGWVFVETVALSAPIDNLPVAE